MDAYTANGSTLSVRLGNGSTDAVGTLVPSAPASFVLSLLNRAAREQDNRRYTASARLYAAAERWIV